MRETNSEPRITEAERQVVEVVWENGEAACPEIVKQVGLATGWKDNTIYTLLSRLAKKKVLRIDKTVSPNVCTPLIGRQEYQKTERKSFIQKVYHGSLSLMLANIIEDESLTEEEINKLKEMLDRRSGEQKKVR